MKVIVIGAYGFIGGALLDVLSSDKEIEVVGVARRPLPIRKDVTNILVNNYIESPDGDVLIHLAEDSDTNFVNISKNNDLISQLLADRYGFGIYASTQLLYGELSNSAHHTSEKVTANNEYTTKKLVNEEMFLFANGAVARLANVYGPSMKSGTVVAEILSQIPGHGPIYVRNSETDRDFIWIEDVANGLARIAKNSISGVFNIGSGVAISITELAKLALDLAGESSRSIVSDSFDPSTIILDIDDTKKLLGWCPYVQISDGLSRMLGSKL